MVHSQPGERDRPDHSLRRGPAPPLPTSGAAPVGIAAGWDGSLWFAEIGAGRIGRLTTGRAGVEITGFALPEADCRPHAVAVAPDGTCWFTEWATGRIGSVTPDGTITEHPLTHRNREPHGLAFGPDGTLYVAEEHSGISRWEVHHTA